MKRVLLSLIVTLAIGSGAFAQCTGATATSGCAGTMRVRAVRATGCAGARTASCAGTMAVTSCAGTQARARVGFCSGAGLFGRRATYIAVESAPAPAVAPAAQPAPAPKMPLTPAPAPMPKTSAPAPAVSIVSTEAFQVISSRRRLLSCN